MIWAVVLADVHATYVSYDPHYGLGGVPLPLGLPSTSSSLYHPSSPTNISLSIHDIYPARPTNPLDKVSPLFLLGVISTVSGACLRRWCFKTLGHFFTFELTIRPSHALITSGPYAFVRHPSYTGIYLTLLGASAVAFAPGSLLRESWLSPLLTPASFQRTLEVGPVVLLSFVVFWFVKVWYALRSMHTRLHVEDVELHKAFGETWEEYAGRVPWRLIPGVF